MDKQVFVDGALDEEPSSTSRLRPGNYRDNWDIETLVEQICDELEGAVDRADVDQVVQEIIPRFEHARIKCVTVSLNPIVNRDTLKAFVPIFIRKEAMDLLRRS